MHAIGSLEGVTLLEFEPEQQEEQHAAQEQEVQAEGWVNVEDLPECPDHQPSSFLKGKVPEHYKPPIFLQISLMSFMFDALGYRSCLKTLDAYNLLVHKYTLNPV